MTSLSEGANNTSVAFNVRPVDTVLGFAGAMMLVLDAGQLADLGIIASFGDIGVWRYVVLTIAVVFALVYGIEVARHMHAVSQRRRVLREGAAATGRVVAISPAVSVFNFPQHWLGWATRYVVAFKSEIPGAEPRLHRTRALTRSKVGSLSAGDAIDIRYDPMSPQTAFWLGEA